MPLETKTEQEPDRLREWDHLVDSEGIYTPEAYAAKLGVTLPVKETYFDCSRLCRRISESDCLKRCGGAEEPCRKCDLTPLNRRLLRSEQLDFVVEQDFPGQVCGAILTLADKLTREHSPRNGVQHVSTSVITPEMV